MWDCHVEDRGPFGLEEPTVVVTWQETDWNMTEEERDTAVEEERIIVESVDGDMKKAKEWADRVCGLLNEQDC